MAIRWTGLGDPTNGDDAKNWVVEAHVPTAEEMEGDHFSPMGKADAPKKCDHSPHCCATCHHPRECVGIGPTGVGSQCLWCYDIDSQSQLLEYRERKIRECRERIEGLQVACKALEDRLGKVAGAGISPEPGPAILLECLGNRNVRTFYICGHPLACSGVGVEHGFVRSCEWCKDVETRGEEVVANALPQESYDRWKKGWGSMTVPTRLAFEAGWAARSDLKSEE